MQSRTRGRSNLTARSGVSGRFRSMSCHEIRILIQLQRFPYGSTTCLLPVSTVLPSSACHLVIPPLGSSLLILYVIPRTPVKHLLLGAEIILDGTLTAHVIKNRHIPSPLIVLKERNLVCISCHCNTAQYYCKNNRKS